MHRRRIRAGQEGLKRRETRFLRMGALLLVQIHGAAASTCRTTAVAGAYHTCAILDDATVKCWGLNSKGQLGQADTETRGDGINEMGAKLLAVDLGDNRTAVSVSAGWYHTCAVLDDATVKCWGENDKGQLGYGDKIDRGDGINEMGAKLLAVDLGDNRTAVSVSAGKASTCAVLDDATVKCWGTNANGELGYGHSKTRGDGSSEMGANLPVVDLGAGRRAVSVSAGTYHVCAVLDDATVKCWGYNGDGQLGYGDTTDRRDGSEEEGAILPAVDLGENRTAVSVSASYRHTCALLDDATVKCWGGNGNGELGYGDTSYRGTGGSEMGEKLPAVHLGDNRTAVSVSTGTYHTCALLDDATVKCWGYNWYGELGYGEFGDQTNRRDGSEEEGAKLLAVDLGDNRTAVSVSAGYYNTCAVLDDATVKCWGWNEHGKLGYGDKIDRGDGTHKDVDLGAGRTVAPASCVNTTFTPEPSPTTSSPTPQTTPQPTTTPEPSPITTSPTPHTTAPPTIPQTTPEPTNGTHERPRWSADPACSFSATWAELAEREGMTGPAFETGGLGSLTEPAFKVWVCEQGHACASGASDFFCFVFDEVNKAFVPWGSDSQLRLLGNV